MIMIVISFALVKFYAFAILYVLIVMQIKLVVVVVAPFEFDQHVHLNRTGCFQTINKLTSVFLLLNS